LDRLLSALEPYSEKSALVEFPGGYVALVSVEEFIEADESESGIAAWRVEIQQVLEDSPRSRQHGAEILFLSLDPNEDTPLRVTTPEGDVIWQQGQER